jgi:hypothetical protein
MALMGDSFRGKREVLEGLFTSNTLDRLQPDFHGRQVRPHPGQPCE